MSNDIKILDDILYRGLQPWLEENASEEKFAPLLSSIKEVTPDFTLQYRIDFERPFNHKTKYYARLINTELIKTCNHLHALISADNDRRLIKYWLDDTLNKKLKTRLSDLGKLIRERDYSTAWINPKKMTYDVDQEHKSNTYIIQLLKLAYMQLYLELQAAFKQWIDDILIIDDFYTQLLFEPVLEKLYLKRILVIEAETGPEPTVAAEPEVPYRPKPLSFTYKQLAIGHEKLTDLCNSLKKNNFIAQDTTAANFKKVFSGKEITTPVRWTGTVSDFYYFIKLIHTDHKLVENLKQQQWEIACKCFVRKDGSMFDRSKMRGQKRPASTGDLLDKAVELIK